MKQHAHVQKIEQDEALLTVKRQSICEGCHKEGACHSCSQVLEIRVKNTCGAEVGDTVEIETGSGAVIGVAALVFLLPLLVAFLAYWLFEKALGPSGYAYLVALLAMVLTYLVIALITRKLNKTLSVTMTAVLEKHSEPLNLERQNENDYE